MSTFDKKISAESFISEQKSYIQERGTINKKNLTKFANALISGKEIDDIPEKSDQIWLKQLLEAHAPEAIEPFIQALNKARGNQPFMQEMLDSVNNAAIEGRFSTKNEYQNNQPTVKEQEFKSSMRATITAAQAAQDTVKSEEKYGSKRPAEEGALEEKYPSGKRQKTEEIKRLGDPEASKNANIQETIKRTMNNTEITDSYVSVKDRKRKFEELGSENREDSELEIEGPKKPRLDLNIETGNTNKLKNQLDQLAKQHNQNNQGQSTGRQ